MEISIMGYIFIPLGIFMFMFLKNDVLLSCSILACGLTGSSLINFGDTPLQPSYYFALLWMIKVLIERIVKGRLYLTIYKDRKIVTLTLFVTIALLSLEMPILKSGITTMNIEGQIVPLKFTSANITQFIYLLFCFLYFYFLYDYLRNHPYEYKKLKKLLIISVVLVVLITLWQMIAYKFDIPFDIIFKTGMHGKRQGMYFWDKRISGPCLEASMLAYFLVAALPLCARIKNIYLRYVLVVLLIFIGIETLSSTFLVGALAWVLIELFLYLKSRKIKIKKKPSLLFFALLVIGLLALLITGDLTKLIDKVNDLVIAFIAKMKIQNQSGQERSEAFEILLEAYSKSPMLGIGFGSSRGKDLFSTWLANTGTVGMLLILMFLYFNCINIKDNKDIKISVLLTWFCMFISVAEPYNLFIWIYLNLTKSYQQENLK